MNIEDQARREAEELLRFKLRSAIADKEMVVNQANRDVQCYDGWSCDYKAWQDDCDAVINGLLKEIEAISERTKAQPLASPWNKQQIIDAAVESFDIGPEDEDAVLRFGMKLQDMEDAERKAQPPAEEVMEVIMQWLSERSSLTGELRDRLATLFTTSAAMADIERCQAKG
jgi:hypothetical protein